MRIEANCAGVNGAFLAREFASTSATAPVTSGVAIEVPLRYASELFGASDRMLRPGATMKKFIILLALVHDEVDAMQALPGRVEKLEIWLFASTLPTISRFASATLALPE